MIKYIFVSLMMLVSFQANAVNTWYWGSVTQVITYQSDGSFIVYLENPTIKSICAYQRVNFMVSDMGVERTRAALSMAMTALVSSRQYGVVVDLPAQGAVCNVPSSSSQGAALR